ncbi:hypothetical protein P691DRAFT_768584 [Macrolepiota fuliginosa MF-IS2]|uniref:Uncharacterized protein n=1 Tax=Macrolepiota fuliginosa MF-IS2 TaxID=1400762 RepID=A0A9P5WZ20_9AGAR|nr:hypothetical protein P691DRAFT_768584 [Macrolepiota fuliginosa MF-IS2]
MGSGGNTAKTLDEIKADLRVQLEDNARQELKNLGGSPGNNDSLVKTVPKITRRQFWKTYGYEYNGNPIDGSGPVVIPVPRAPELCDVVPLASNQVTCQINIPDQAIKRKAVNDLYNHIHEIVTGAGTGNKWVTLSYNKSYDMTENVNNCSIKCNSTLIYIYGNLLEDGTHTEIAFICFCGVYYMADSLTVQARRGIKQAVYRTAPPMPGGRQPTIQEQLKASLEGASKTEFRSCFGFPFSPGDPNIPSSYPPDSYCARGVKSAQFTLNSGLHIIPDPRPGINIKSYIDELYMGLNIPEKTIQDQSRKNITAHYNTIIKNSQDRDRLWVTNTFNQTFETSAISVNQTCQIAILRCWYGHETISGGTTISMLFIHIIMMVYEMEDAVAAQESVVVA